MAEWRTTILGVLAIAGSVVALGVKFFQGDPITLDEILTIGGTIGAGLGLVAAKDA